MKTTVYVPCYNGSRTLDAVLQAVLRQARPADEIVVVDDGSTDRTAEVAESFADRGVRLRRHSRNQGLGAARNLALREAGGDVLVGLDSDVAPDPDYLRQVVHCFKSRPEVGAICGRLVEAHTGTPADRWRAVHMSQDLGAESSPSPRCLFGCTTSIRRRVALEVGGWNQRFRNSYEDVDLTQRLRARNVKLRYESRCRARHLRRDDPHSVLTAFWKWHFPAGEIQGHFDSLEAWIEKRIEAVQWGIFRFRLAQDLQAGRHDLVPLTTLLPWWMTLLDLRELQRRHHRRRALIACVARRLPFLARDLMPTQGPTAPATDWIAGELERFAAEFAAVDHARHPLVEAAVQAITRAAARPAAVC